MPIYEFSCSDCRAVFEKLVWKSGAPELRCPACGSSRIDELVSTFASIARGGSTASGGSTCAPGGG